MRTRILLAIATATTFTPSHRKLKLHFLDKLKLLFLDNIKN